MALSTETSGEARCNHTQILTARCNYTHIDLDHDLEPKFDLEQNVNLSQNVTLTWNLTLTQNLTLIQNLIFTLSLTLTQIDFADKGFKIKTLLLSAFLVLTITRAHQSPFPLLLHAHTCDLRIIYDICSISKLHIPSLHLQSTLN